MWDVKPGDLVVYVGGLLENPWHAAALAKRGFPKLVLNTIYTVYEPVQPEDKEIPEGGLWLRLEEVRGYRWAVAFFRPIQKPSIESLRGLLVPTKGKELTDA